MNLVSWCLCGWIGLFEWSRSTKSAPRSVVTPPWGRRVNVPLHQQCSVARLRSVSHVLARLILPCRFRFLATGLPLVCANGTIIAHYRQMQQNACSTPTCLSPPRASCRERARLRSVSPLLWRGGVDASSLHDLHLRCHPYSAPICTICRTVTTNPLPCSMIFMGCPISFVFPR